MAENIVNLKRRNLEHAVNVFVNVSSFVRYLVEDVLSWEIFNGTFNETDTFEKLIEECDYLVKSVSTFKQILNTENVTLSDSCKISDNLTGTRSSLSDEFCKSQVKQASHEHFFCQICNRVAGIENDLNMHCVSKQHIEKSVQLAEPLEIKECKRCHLVLMAPTSEISALLYYDEDHLYDKHIKRLMKGPEEDKGRVESSNRKQTIPHQDIHSSSPTVKSDIIISDKFSHSKLKQLFISIKEFFQKSTNKSDVVVPHYCNMCEVVVSTAPDFINHISSKQHIVAINSGTEPIHIFKCDKCGLLITGYQIIIDNIVDSAGHRELDEGYFKFLDCGENNKETTTLNICNSNFNTAKQNTLSKKYKQYLISNYKITKANKKNHEIGGCFVCSALCYGKSLHQHLLGRKHREATRLASTHSTYSLHKCSLCSISIFGTSSQAENILNSSEHGQVHELFIKYKGEKSSTNLSIINRDNELSKIQSQPLKCLTTYIPDNFFKHNYELLLHGEGSAKEGYCRPCGISVDIRNGWQLHFTSKDHVKNLSEYDFKKVPLACSYCPLHIFGDDSYFMDIHMKLNHSNINNGSNITEAPLEPNSARTAALKNTNNKDYFKDGLKLNDDDDDKEEEMVLSSEDDTISKETILKSDLISIDDSNKVITEELTPVNTDDNCMDTFVEFLRERKQVYIDAGLKKFGGMCLICIKICKDYSEWLDHLNEYCHGNIKQNDLQEKECETCNLSLYGKKMAIESIYWPLIEHLH